MSRLNQVGFEYAVGFALNTSNYQTTAASKSYGQQISQQLGGKKFVIDTSRNGNGSNGEWCNPRGRALGEKPTLVNDGVGPRRPALGQAARRVRRHVQRRPVGRCLVPGHRPGAGPQREVVTTPLRQ